MKTRSVAIVAIVASAMSVLAAPRAGAHHWEEAKLVAKDEASDWGQNSALGSQGAAIGDALGQDLVEGWIEMAEEADEPTVNFILRVTSLPRFGGWPEATRYVWSLDVDGEYVELDGKYLNYSRGVCEPTSGQCPPPRDPGLQPFIVRGNCTIAQNVTTCEELGVVQGAFSPHDGAPLHLPRPPASITVPVPLEMLGAKLGSTISVGMSDLATYAGGPIIAMPDTYLNVTAMPLDTMQMVGTFKVAQ